jgi:hypothetical protein
MSPYDSWKATETLEEREEDRRDYADPPLYRLMFSYPRWNYLDGNGGCVARFQRLDEATKRWVTLDSGVGNDEAAAIRELRSARYEARSLGRELKAFAERKAARS